MKHIFTKTRAITLTELMVSITISVVVLGGIFYFISQTTSWLVDNTSRTNFMHKFHNFSSIFHTGDFQIITQDGYDLWLLVSSATGEGVLIGVVNQNTQKLIPEEQYTDYLPGVLAYRQLSKDNVDDLLESDPTFEYSDLMFDRAFMFENFYVRDLSFQAFNKVEGEDDKHLLHELELRVYNQYKEGAGTMKKSDIPFEESFVYNIIF